MLDCDTLAKLIDDANSFVALNQILIEIRIDVMIKSHAMQGILIAHRNIFFPNRRTSNIATFTD